MRFRFTIRDLLWLTALVAVFAGWSLDRSSLKWTIGEILNSEAECKAKLTRAENEIKELLALRAQMDNIIRSFVGYVREHHPDEADAVSELMRQKKDQSAQPASR